MYYVSNPVNVKVWNEVRKLIFKFNMKNYSVKKNKQI